MIRHINDVLDVNFNEYSRRFPAFFYVDERGQRTKPAIIPAQAIAADKTCPMYFRRLIDVGTLAGDPYYLLFNADPLRGDASREAAVEFFGDFLYDKLGLQSSFDVDSGMRPTDEYPLNGTMDREEALNAEVLPAGDDREYHKYYDEQLAKMNADKEEKRMQDFEKEHGFRPDDPDIIDVSTDDEPASKATGSAVGKATTTAVGRPNKIWYGVDLHIPSTGTRLGYNGRGAGSDRVGGSGRRGIGRGPSGYLREKDEDMKKTIKNGRLAEAELSQQDVDDISDMFAGYGGRPQSTWLDRRLTDFMNSHAAELKNVLAGSDHANGLGDLGHARDLGSDDMYECMMKEALGTMDSMTDDPDGEDAAMEKAGYGDDTIPELPSQRSGRKEYNGSRLGYGKTNEAELSDADRREIAGMFAGYGGRPQSTWGKSVLGSFLNAHAAELKAIANGSDQAAGLGDLAHAQDLGSDDALEESAEKKESKLDLIEKLQALCGKDSPMWADLEELKEKYDLSECDRCGDPDCKDGEKCGLKEDDEALNEEIDEIVGDSQEEQDAEAAGPLTEYCIEEEETDEDDDVLSESFVRHSTMLAREQR